MAGLSLTWPGAGGKGWLVFLSPGLEQEERGWLVFLSPGLLLGAWFSLLLQNRRGYSRVMMGKCSRLDPKAGGERANCKPHKSFEISKPTPAAHLLQPDRLALTD